MPTTEAQPAFPKTDRVMHSQLTAPGLGLLMASDCPPGVEGDPQTGLTIMLTPHPRSRKDGASSTR